MLEDTTSRSLGGCPPVEVQPNATLRLARQDIVRALDEGLDPDDARAEDVMTLDHILHDEAPGILRRRWPTASARLTASHCTR